MKRLYLDKTSIILPIVLILSGICVLAVYRSSPMDSIIAGHILVFLGCVATLIFHRKELSLGSVWVWIPLVLVVVSATYSGRDPAYENQRWVLNLFMTGYLAYMLLLYIAGVRWGEKYFGLVVLFGALVAVTALVELVVVYAFNNTDFTFFNNEPSGASGIVSNSNVAGCLMGVSLFFCKGRLKWFVPLLLLGILATGAHGAMLGLGLAGVIWLFLEGSKIRLSRYISKVALVSVGALLVLVALLGSSGILGRLYDGGPIKYDKGETSIVQLLRGEIALDYFMRGRLEQARFTLDRASWIGHGQPAKIMSDGEVLDRFAVHNASLEILDEQGIVAAVAWTFVVLYMVFKARGKYRYLWIFLLTVSMFSNFTWWPYILGPMVWYMFGVSQRKEVQECQEVILS